MGFQNGFKSGVFDELDELDELELGEELELDELDELVELVELDELVDPASGSVEALASTDFLCCDRVTIG